VGGEEGAKQRGENDAIISAPECFTLRSVMCTCRERFHEKHFRHGVDEDIATDVINRHAGLCSFQIAQHRPWSDE